MWSNGQKVLLRNGTLVIVDQTKDQGVVWSIPLRQGEVTGFTIRQAQEGWALGMLGTDGSFTPLADFESKSQAKSALKCLMRKMRYQGWGGRLMGLIFVVFLIGAAYFSYGLVQYQRQIQNRNALIQESSGKPLSADEALTFPQ